MPARVPAEKPGTTTGKEPSRQPRERGVVAPRQVAQLGLPPADILQLQRMMGNRAVGRLLRTALPRGTGAALVQEAARAGVAGPGVPLPHRERIQQSFGHHDLSAVQAHTDPAAAQIARALHAHAYATGNAIAFDRPDPDLRTAAHEAAHTIQQRGGVQLKGGVGQAGDAYERAADAVAERVVQGQSAADLLDAQAPAGAAPPAGAVVQGDEFTDFILQLIEDNQLLIVMMVFTLCETFGLTDLTRRIMDLLGLGGAEEAAEQDDGGQQDADGGAQANNQLVALGLQQLNPVIVPQIDALAARLGPLNAPEPEGGMELALPNQAPGQGAVQQGGGAARGPLFVPVNVLQQVLGAGQQALGGQGGGFISLERLAELFRAQLGQGGGGRQLALPEGVAAQLGAIYLDIGGLAQLLDGINGQQDVLNIDISRLLITEQQLLAPQGGALEGGQPLPALEGPGMGQLDDAPNLLPELALLPRQLLGRMPQLNRGFQLGLRQQRPELARLADMFYRQHAMAMVRGVPLGQNEQAAMNQLALAPPQARQALQLVGGNALQQALAGLHPTTRQLIATLSPQTQQAFLALPVPVLVALLRLPRSALETIMASSFFEQMLELPLDLLIKFAVDETMHGAEPYETAAEPNANVAAVPAFTRPQDQRSTPYMQEHVARLFPNLTVAIGEYADPQSPLFQLSINQLTALNARTVPNLVGGMGQRLFTFVADARQRALVAPQLLIYLNANLAHLRITRGDLDRANHDIYTFSAPSLQAASQAAAPNPANAAFTWRAAYMSAEDARREAIVRYAAQHLPNLRITRAEVNDQLCIIYQLTNAQLASVHANLSGRNVTQWQQINMPATRNLAGTTYLMPTHVQGLTFRGADLEVGGEVFVDWYIPRANHGINIATIRQWINLIEHPPAYMAPLQVMAQYANRTYGSPNFAARLAFNNAESLLITAFRENI